MQPLNDAIATVLREVERGFAARRTAGGLPLTPERIRLTFNFTLNASSQTAHADPGGPHSVTVEFKVGEAGQWQAVAPVAEVAAKAPAPSGIVPVLTQIFGAPGFESSARATVFGETLTGQSHEAVMGAVVALRPDATPITDAAIKQMSQILRGIIQSGPTKNVAQGAELLIGLFTEHALMQVLRVAETTWKTHEDWLG